MTVEPTPYDPLSAPEPEHVAAPHEQLAAAAAQPESADPGNAESGHSEPSSPATTAWHKPALAAALILALALPFAFLLHHRAEPPDPSPAAAPAVPSIAALEQLVRSQPTAGNRLALSMAYINAQQPARALPVLNALLAADPANARAWNNLCVAHMQQLEYNHALEECSRAVSLEPGYQLAKNNLAWAQRENQKSLDAIAAADQAAPAARDTSSYLNEGLQCLHVGDYDKAITLWQQVLRSDAHNPLAANDIGVAYMMKHQPASAIPWFNKALAFDPTMQLVKNNLAWANSEQSSTQKPTAAKSK